MCSSRIFILLLVCMAVGILCVPGAASAHGSAQRGEPGGSDSGSTGSAGSPASSGLPGFSHSAHSEGSGTPAAATGAGTARADGMNGAAESGTGGHGAAAGDTGSFHAGEGGERDSSETGVRAGSSQVSGTDHAPVPGPAEQGESARITDSGSSGGPQPGIPGAAAPGSGHGVPGDGSRYQRTDGIGISAGFVLMGAAGGTARGSGTIQVPVMGDEGPGGPAREGSHRPPCDPCRDAAQKSAPPETPARIEQGNSEPSAKPRGKREDEQEGVRDTCSHTPAARTPDSVPGKAIFFLFSLFGFRRIRKKNVLENDRRRAVFQAIADTPGMDAVSLSRRLEMNINTLRYHLAKLLATDKITYLSRPGAVRYFLNQGKYSPFEQVFFHFLMTGTAGRIMQLVSERPGISRKDLAAVLEISGPSVTRHIQELSSEGIIRNEPDKRANHYYLTDEADQLFGKWPIVPAGLHPYSRVDTDRCRVLLPE